MKGFLHPNNSDYMQYNPAWFIRNQIGLMCQHIYIDTLYFKHVNSALMYLSKGGMTLEKLESMLIDEREIYLEQLQEMHRKANEPQQKNSYSQDT